MDESANILQKLDHIESFLGSVTSMQVQLPTAWRDTNKSVPAEGVDVLLWQYLYTHCTVTVGRRVGNKFIHSLAGEEFELDPLYWMPLPPDPPRDWVRLRLREMQEK